MDSLTTKLKEFLATLNKEELARLGVKSLGRNVSSSVTTQDLSIKVSDALKKIGVPLNVKGYRFVLSAIIDVTKNPAAIERVTQGIYPKVAKEFDTTPTRVERSIRHAIDLAWERGDAKTQNKIFAHTYRNRPTNSEFIATVADFIRLGNKL